MFLVMIFYCRVQDEKSLRQEMELGEQKNGHNSHSGSGPSQQQSNNSSKYKQSEPVGEYNGV